MRPAGRHVSFSFLCLLRRLFLQLQRTDALRPLAGLIFHELLEGDLGFRDRRDLPVVLAEIITNPDLVQCLVCRNDGVGLPLLDDDPHHLEGLQRIGFQRLTATVGIGHEHAGLLVGQDFTARQKMINDAFKPVSNLIEELKKSGNSPSSIIAGGTPSFPIHARYTGVETSPGTLILWDYGYSSSYQDMDFMHAAILLSRVISKPAEDLICIDLGHKAIASEMPQPRIKLLGLENYTIVGHNEEHMVVKTADAAKMKIGDVLYGIPFHICPTVDRYDSVTVIKEGMAAEQWNVEARKRKITY